MPKSKHSNPPDLPKYVFRDKTKSGLTRYRFRKPGLPKIRLLGEPGSPEFLKAYEEALKQERPAIGESRTIPGTINEIVVSLYQHSTWTTLAPSTRDGHRYRLERLREKHGDKPAAAFDAAHVHLMLAKLTPVNQKNWIKTLRILFRSAERPDPTKGYRLPRIESIPHKRWQDEDIRQYEAHHPIGTKARLALALFKHTGMRKSDIVRLGPQHIHKGKIAITTQKTGERLVLPLAPELAEIIAATTVVGTITFLVTKHGKPHTVKGFGNYMRDWCNEAGLPDLSAHGIRHALGAQMSEEQATVPEIMAVLGHKDPRMAMHYSSQANQARLAENAFAKLSKRES